MARGIALMTNDRCVSNVVRVTAMPSITMLRLIASSFKTAVSVMLALRPFGLTGRHE